MRMNVHVFTTTIIVECTETSYQRWQNVAVSCLARAERGREQVKE